MILGKNSSSSAKKAPKKSSSSVKIALVIVGVVLLSLTLSVWAYKTIRYHSAPEAIKQIRKEPIYSYESENLKIVRINEDYGGKDWKGATQSASVYVNYESSSASDATTSRRELEDALASSGWSEAERSQFDVRGERYRYSKTVDGQHYSLSFVLGDENYLIIRVEESGSS